MSQLFDNPTPDELRAFTEEMPETRISGFGNVNVQTTVLSRSAASTYVVDRESSGKTMTRADYDTIARQLNLTDGALRGLLHRGLVALREQFTRSTGVSPVPSSDRRQSAIDLEKKL